MINEQLKESTQPSHQALEKKMVSMIRKIHTRQDYVKFLKLMYGYYSALEKRVQEYVSELEIGKRRKAERLLEDISYFESMTTSGESSSRDSRTTAGGESPSRDSRTTAGGESSSRDSRTTASFEESLPQGTLPDASWNELPAIRSHAEALGAMYVMEGSTMGGKIIARMIEGQAGISGPSGFSFFNGYGEETGRMWEEFKVFLNRPLDEMEKLNMILTANRTFITFYNWIDKHAATS